MQQEATVFARLARDRYREERRAWRHARKFPRRPDRAPPPLTAWSPHPPPCRSLRLPTTERGRYALGAQRSAGPCQATRGGRRTPASRETAPVPPGSSAQGRGHRPDPLAGAAARCPPRAGGSGHTHAADRAAALPGAAPLGTRLPLPSFWRLGRARPPGSSPFTPVPAAPAQPRAVSSRAQGARAPLPAALSAQRWQPMALRLRPAECVTSGTTAVPCGTGSPSGLLRRAQPHGGSAFIERDSRSQQVARARLEPAQPQMSARPSGGEYVSGRRGMPGAVVQGVPVSWLAQKVTGIAAGRGAFPAPCYVLAHGTGCPGRWARSQAAGVQSFQTSGFNPSWGCVETDVGLHDPCGFLPTWDTLWFYFIILQKQSHLGLQRVCVGMLRGGTTGGKGRDSGYLCGNKRGNAKRWRTMKGWLHTIASVNSLLSAICLLLLL